MTTQSWEELAKHLPSRTNFYNKFEEGAKECKDNFTSNVDSALSSLNGRGRDSVNRIKAAWYYAHYMYKGIDNKNNSAPCEFLYYWIGDLLLKNLDEKSLKTPLQNICNGIKNAYWGKGCKLTCEPIDEKMFSEMKIIFDFLYDHQHIDDYLVYYTTNHSTNFSNYRIKIKETAGAMDKECNDEGDTYCKNFWKNNKAKFNGKIAELQSKITYAEELKTQNQLTEQTKTAEAVKEAVRQAEANLSYATTTASLTSILGTLATVATPFLLYKYNYVPSGISNLFGGRNGEKGTRRKRRRSIGHHFDASTEDALTEYTTDNSTIDPTDGDSSTLHSDVFSTRQSSRGGNNTGDPRIVGYQNM